MKSQILVTKYSEGTKKIVTEMSQNLEILWFNSKALSIDEVRNIIKESYESSENGKVIAIETKKLSQVSQNGLLKVLEEPPRNTFFVLIVPSKSMLLPTVRSRLPVKIIESKKEPLNYKTPKISNLDLKVLDNFLNSIKDISVEEATLLLENTLLKNRDFLFSSEDLDRFSIGIKLLNLHSRPHRIFLMVLLPFAIKT
jgi:DNA polymerase-3 subunit delta'